MFSHKTNKILKPFVSDKYLLVYISKNNIKKAYRIHRLVIEHFLYKCPEGHIVNHKDGNRSNNHIDNLEYVTYKQNALHACNVLGKVNIKLKPEQVLEIVALYKSGEYQKDIANKFGISAVSVSGIVTGRMWSYVTGIIYKNKYKNLSDSQAKDIRNMFASGRSKQQIADVMGVHFATVHDIINNKYHKEKIITYKEPPRIDNNEKFLDILGYEHIYQISSYGRVWNKIRGRVMKLREQNGYPTVSLCKNKKQAIYSVHYLVTQAFCGECPDGYVVNHKDGNRQNNHCDNLEYVTRQENCFHSCYVLGKDKMRFNAKDIQDIIDLYKCRNRPVAQISEKFDVGERTIYGILEGKNWSHITGIKKKDAKKRLTKDEVIAIATTYKTGSHTQKQLADEFNVHEETIGNLIRGVYWSDITGIVCSKTRAERTEEQILEVIKSYYAGLTQKEISQKFNIPQNTISYIVNKKSWKQLHEEYLESVTNTVS